MAANIHDIMAADMAATAFDTDAAESPSEETTYTPPGGEGVTVTVIVLPEDIEAADDEQGATQIRRRRVIMDTGETTPEIRAELTLESIQWKVTAIDNKRPNHAVLTVVSDTPKSRHYESHKRKIE